MSVRVRFPSGAREQASQTAERPVFLRRVKHAPAYKLLKINNIQNTLHLTPALNKGLSAGYFRTN